MLNSYEVKELKVGDRVAFGRWGGSGLGYLSSTGFGVVTKINGHGHINVKRDSGADLVFDKRGEQRGTEYGVSLMAPESLERHQAAETEKRRQREIYNRLEQAVKDMNRYGHLHADEERKQQLIAIINEF